MPQTNMAKKVGDVKNARPEVRVDVSQPAEVAEIVTITNANDSSPPEIKAEEKLKTITAQEILDKPESELKELGVGKREAHNIAQTFRIITAILLGKNKNKDLAQTLHTDKSFVAKQVKELEERGLVKKEEEGREVRYVADQFNILKFLQSKVVITSKKESGRSGAQENNKNG